MQLHIRFRASLSMVAPMSFPLTTFPLTMLSDSPLKSLRIVPASGQTTASKSQKIFNALVQNIESLRQELVQWQAATDAARQKLEGQIQPLSRQFNLKLAEFVRGIDQMMDHKAVTKADHRIATDVICRLCAELIELTADDALADELKEIYNRYAGQDYDAAHSSDDGVETDAAAFKANMEERFGLDLSDLPSEATVQELSQLIMERIEAQQADRSTAPPFATPPLKKKSTKKRAREEAQAAAQKAEADQASLSIREIYRKLASALHPDREPDAAERDRKTILMQRVNQAYDKNDLLKLLELQLELEHIDGAHIASLSEERLKHYNNVLKDQVKELHIEIDHVQRPLRMMMQVPSYMRFRESDVRGHLAGVELSLKNQLLQVQSDLRVLGDVPALKAWLKAYKREAKEIARQESPWW